MKQTALLAKVLSGVIIVMAIIAAGMAAALLAFELPSFPSATKTLL